MPTNPSADPNPGTPSQPETVDCTLNQAGQVWFLAGISFAQSFPATYRSCSVPAGVFLFFPVVAAWNDNLNCPPPPFTTTADQLALNVQQQTDGIVPGSMKATIDGVDVSGLADSSTAFRAAAGGFSYTLPSDTLLSAAFCSTSPIPAGTTTPPPGAFADGVYILRAPLSMGVHHLHWTAQEVGGPLGPVSQDVTYTITVHG